MPDRITKIVLRGDVRGLQGSMTVANRSMQTLRGEIRQVGTQSVRSQGQLSGLLKVAAGSAAVVGLGRLAKESVQLEAAYSRTMAQVAVATQAPAASLERLDALAMKLGADTVFSAQDAATAMLELAKGGLSTAEIEAGALADTLTLASAGGLELGEAANVVVQAMGAFRLEATQTDEAVAALAGGANASSADVSDMTQALAQAGTTSNSVGLSIQDTTAYLALFADQGFKGSDAGTSLRTMLSRLVPQTKDAEKAMAALGLTYTDANGQIVSAEEIAARTQAAFRGLTDEQRVAAVNTIFGMDAQRAVNAITAEGVDGFREYKEATSDLTQAQKLAAAANSGTAGALEQLDGAVETAKIQIGKGLAPVLQDAAGDIANLIENGDLEGWAEGAGRYIQNLVEELTPLAVSGYELGREVLPVIADAGGTAVDVLELLADVATPVLDAFNKLPDAAQQAIILAAGAQLVGRRLGPIENFAGRAGESLLLFGGNAEKSGEKAKAASGKYAALGTNLKGTAVLLAAGLALPEIGSDAKDIFDSLDTLRDKSRDLAGTMRSDGTATADTLQLIGDRLGSGALGKNAAAAGIDLDRLARSLAKDGKYAQQVLADLDESFRDRNPLDEATATATTILPFLDSDAERARNMKSALRDLMGELDEASRKAVEQVEQQRLSANAWLISAAGLDEYRSELMGLPTEVITKILTPGAIDSAKDIEALVRKYKLTPDLVRTIISLSGADISAEQMRDILDLSDRINRRRTRATVRAVTSAAETGLRNVLGLLNQVTDRDATVTIRQNIKRSYSDQGPSSGSLADMLVDPAGIAKPRATGGPILRAEGGPVRGPGTGTSDSIPAIGPRGDRYRLSNGEHIWTAAEVDAAGGHEAMYAMRDAVLAQRNAMAYGGAVGTTTAARTGPLVADLVGATAVLRPDGLIEFVDGRVRVAQGEQQRYQTMSRKAGRQ